MPLIHPLERQKFSEAGPLPQVLNMGDKLAVMLLCLQGEQALHAPEGDSAETLFCVLAGDGSIVEGETQHSVAAGDVVHIPPGTTKALIAHKNFTVLGVRVLKGHHVKG